MTEFIGTGDIARITGKTQRTILNWLAKGKIPGHKIGGEWLIEEIKARPIIYKIKKGKSCPSTSEVNGTGLSSVLTVKQSDDQLKQRLNRKH